MQFDFVVIGGGPAGASAARRLARAGASVALLERVPKPRYKPCGGALSQRGEAWLDFPIPPSLIHREIFGTRLHIGGRVTDAKAADRLAVLVGRAEFDALLLEKAEEAGARILWQDVRFIDGHARGVRLATAVGDLEARCAIICDGASGRLGRTVRGSDPPDRVAFCLQAEVPVRQSDPYGDLDGLLDVYYELFDYGYGWVFHHGTHYAVGIQMLKSVLRDPRETFRQFAAARGLDLDGVRLWGHFLPSGGAERQTVADRLLLAGDAAGYADPVHGEGIAYAIRSGQLAAETALAAAQRGDFSRRGLTQYAERCRWEFGEDLAAARRLFMLMNGRAGRAFRRIAGDPEVLDRFLQIAATESSYAEFLQWLLPRAAWLWVRSRWRDSRPAGADGRNSVAAAAGRGDASGAPEAEARAHEDRLRTHAGGTARCPDVRGRK